jgi:hypothetical protein
MENQRPEYAGQVRRASTPYLRRLLTEFYRTAVLDYRRAGSPFGESPEAIMIWFEYGEETTPN